MNVPGLIDHHVHGVVTKELDRAEFESLLTEAPGPPAAGVTMFDSQLGFAVRRWCAPVLDLEPSAPAQEYLRRRSELGVDEVNRRLLTAAGVGMWLVDTGFQGDQLTTPEQLAAASGTPSRHIVRLEAVAEQVARAGTSAAGYAEAFASALAAASESTGAVGYKSVVAYRFGFDFNPARPEVAEVADAAGWLLRALDDDPSTRIEDPVILRHLIWTAIDIGLPLQFHVGFGDTDVRLHRSNPSLLHDFLLETEPIGTPIMLLHCYPFQREAGFLANVFSHVYMDLGAILNHVGARSTAVLAEALELTPFHKMLYSSDAFGLPELHYLGAIGFRRDYDRVTSGFVANLDWTSADARRVSHLIGFENAARVYRLEAPVTCSATADSDEIAGEVGSAELGGAGLGGEAVAGLAKRLRSALAEELDAAIELRHELHAAAEPSGSENWTGARVAAALGGSNVEVVAETGRLVRIGDATGPCIALRAELDALPIAEETGVPWASPTGAMHACGHDVHLAALTAFGRAASRTGLPVPALAVLQPREESIPSGARDIVASGALAAQSVSAVVAVHLQHQLPPGTVAAAIGTVNAATDDFVIRVHGTGGHAGYPQLAADPVVALCQTVVALQQIVSRRSDPTHAVVITVGMIQAGQAANVIPYEAVAHGTLRMLDQGDRTKLRSLLRETVEYTCLATGCRGEVTIEEGEPALVNDEALTVATWPWLEDAGFTVNRTLRSCGADDFSYFTGSAPTLMMFLGTGGPYTLHHPKFLPGDELVSQAAEALLAGYLGALTLMRPELAIGWP